MLVHRCAWHRRYFGYVAYLRVTRDGHWRVDRSDGICRACRDVMLATARGQAPKSLPVRRELARAAMALTGVAAWLLVMLLFAGCDVQATVPAKEYAGVLWSYQYMRSERDKVERVLIDLCKKHKNNPAVVADCHGYERVTVYDHRQGPMMLPPAATMSRQNAR